MNKERIAKILEEVELLLIRAKDWEAGLEADLAEAEEPELEDGDYGIDPLGSRWISLDGILYTNKDHKLACTPFEVRVKERRGNLWDDLESLEEPLKSLTARDVTGLIDGEGNLHLENGSNTIFVGAKHVAEFTSDLRRLLNTAEREANE